MSFQLETILSALGYKECQRARTSCPEPCISKVWERGRPVGKNSSPDPETFESRIGRPLSVLEPLRDGAPGAPEIFPLALRRELAIDFGCEFPIGAQSRQRRARACPKFRQRASDPAAMEVGDCRLVGVAF